MITYNTAAAKYTGKLQGGYTGEFPAPNSEYTELISSILDGNEMKYPSNDFMKSIYSLYGGEIELKPPKSRLTEIIQYGIYSERYNVTSVSDEEIIVSDNETGLKESIYLYDNLEKIWAKIIAKAEPVQKANFITSDGFYIKTADGYLLNVKEVL